MLNRHVANHRTKLEVYHCRGTKNFNRSRDHNHAPFGGDYRATLSAVYAFVVCQCVCVCVCVSVTLRYCITRGSAMAEELRDAVVSSNSVTTKHHI